MSLGTLGSTLNDELNRLANGGTYRDSGAMVDEALAAKQWANRENISPYSTDTVGVLNEIAGLGLDKRNWLDFNGVCNYIAGTSGLPAAAALRQIYPTTDLLTGVASYYVDAATPRYNYAGYIYLPGIATQYLSTPDATALDVTGDIDIRMKVALDDWTPAADTERLLTKRNTNFAYGLKITTTGAIQLNWSADGTTQIAAVSTVSPTVADGAALWIRATLDVDNGATGNTTTFYTSTDGTTWTQLGATVVKAGTTSIYSSSDSLYIGTDINSGYAITGKLYNTQIFAGLTGTDKRLDVDLTTNVTSATFNQFTATTGQLVTINGQDVLTNGGAAGSLLPTTVGSSLAADSNDPKFLDHTGTNYVYLPGIGSNTLSIPDAAALDIVGDIDIRVYVDLDNWTTGAFGCLISKDNESSNISYSLNIENGTLRLDWSADGTTRLLKIATNNCAVGAKWVRATLDVDNGAAGNDVKFYTSSDGTSWTQVGSTVTTAGVTSIYSGTANIAIGAFGSNAYRAAGKYYRAQILNGIDGTTVLNVDTSVITTGAATSFTAVTGQTVTINRSTSGRKTVAVTQPTWLFGTDDYMEVNNRYMAHSTSDENYVYLSGASGNYMSVADNPPLDIAGDLDLQVKVALDDWTPAAGSCLLSKSNATGNQRSYFLGITTGGILQLTTSPDGSTLLTRSCTVATSITDGTVKWVRATIDVDNGSGGNDVKFFLSDDGSTWTQLGTTVTTAGVTSIFNSTTPVEVGSRTNGTIEVSKGKFFRSIVKNGIDGTIVLDADASVITLPSQTTFVDRSSNAYTVTINKSGVGTFVSTGNYLYLPGINSNYASAPDSAALDITGDIDLRVKVALDDWTPSAAQTLIGKWTTSGNQRSYRLDIQTTGIPLFLWTTDGSTTSSTAASVAPTITDGTTTWLRVTRNSTTGDVVFYTSTDGTTWTQLGTTQSTTPNTMFSGTGVLEIGTVAVGTLQPARGKFFRAQVLNGINGTVAFDANFESSITSLLQTSFTESSTNGATVTINRSGSTFRSAGVIDAGYLYPGATNTFANSTTSFLDFGATDSFTAIAIARTWSGSTGFGSVITKNAPQGAIRPGYSIYINNSTVIFAGVICDTTTRTNTNTLNTTTGALNTLSLTRNVANDTITLGGTVATTDTTTGSLASQSQSTLAIGSGSGFVDMEFVAAAVFRQALTATQLRQITNYFANREAYL
jgi:hypothetical protein